MKLNRLALAIFFSIALICVLVGLAEGGECRVVHRQIVAPVVQHKKAVVAPVAVPYYVPQYSLGYYGDYGQGQQLQSQREELNLDRLIRLVELVVTLSDRIDKLERRFGPALDKLFPEKSPQEKPAPEKSGGGKPRDPFNPFKQGDVVTLFTNKCARCHDRSVSAAKGGGFALLDKGRILSLQPGKAGEIAALVYSGEMPPSKPLDDTEVATVMKWLRSLK